MTPQIKFVFAAIAVSALAAGFAHPVGMAYWGTLSIAVWMIERKWGRA